MVYTSYLPSNHFLCLSKPRERERERERLNLGPKACRRCPLDWTFVVSISSLPKACRRLTNLVTHDRSLSFLFYLSLSLNFQSLSLSRSLNLTGFFSLMNGFVLIFVSLRLYIEIFYYKICLEAEKITEKMWETSRKIAFLECNQTPKNTFQNNFHNTAKHLKIFFFPKNVFTWKYFTLGKYFTYCQTQPY